MQVTMRTIGSLRALIGSSELRVTLPDDSRVDDLLRTVSEDHGEEVARHLRTDDPGRVPLSPRILVNGRDIGALDGRATLLHDADDVLVLTPMAGG